MKAVQHEGTDHRVANPVFFGTELDDLAAGHALVDGVFAPLRESYFDTRKRLSRVWPELWFAGPGIIAGAVCLNAVKPDARHDHVAPFAFTRS